MTAAVQLQRCGILLFLEEGIHYQAGFSTNSAFLWEVNGVRAKLAWRGMIQRNAAEGIREQVGA